ncbi:MAG: hypothetical protein AVDCRST_MAG64-746, partial [uncultured Phycisphaerae bacterium]
AAGIQKLEGVLLLCRGDASTERGGAPTAAHYALEYHLRIEDGRVRPAASRFWMAALYFTYDLTDDELWQWFSPEPLPTIPDGFRAGADDGAGRARGPAAGARPRARRGPPVT